MEIYPVKCLSLHGMSPSSFIRKAPETAMRNHSDTNLAKDCVEAKYIYLENQLKCARHGTLCILTAMCGTILSAELLIVQLIHQLSHLAHRQNEAIKEKKNIYIYKKARNRTGNGGEVRPFKTSTAFCSPSPVM